VRNLKIGLPLLALGLLPASTCVAQYAITTLATFDATNGTYPWGGVVADAAGNLYGTTIGNPNYGSYGTIYKVAAGTHEFTTLATFNKDDGSAPQGTLIIDSSGNLYGTTRYGGPANLGTVFEFTHDTHQIVTLGTFNGTNGSQPLGGLVMDSAGNLFGTTSSGGGPQLAGTVFEIAHGTNTVTTLATFSGANGNQPNPTLLLDAGGNLYGTTFYGGAHNQGEVFQVAAGTHALSTLVSFDGTNGAGPRGGVIMDAAGNLYGTTQSIGNLPGSVFMLAAGTHALTTLATFNGTNGAIPSATLLMSDTGTIYGTTIYGGTLDHGTVFELAAGTHALSALVSFTGPNGWNPSGPVIFGPNNSLLGTTQYGGATSGPYDGYGTVFSVSQVPEVSTMALSLMATAVSALVGFARRGAKKSSQRRSPQC